jgi:hypothetical protein
METVDTEKILKKDKIFCLMEELVLRYGQYYF